ncbi:hypothetical protein C7M84_009945 [Penaeus vannamei]|uniref:Uncharacterized protein n=2 Tax=Penaeus vannamei TaxID=6689 RepID=A0A423UA80_PENVA|nr:hypothetical protein C7M84_009945 [Penaeus vannamei]
MKLKDQVKEARKRKLERNKDQQAKKRQRLQKLQAKKLSDELLAEVAAEREAELQQKSFLAAQGKHTTFEDDILDDIGTVDEEQQKDDLIIPLERGVQVRAVKSETKKSLTLAKRAASFRENALFGKNVKRMSGRDQRAMVTKQEKSGKSKLVAVS